MMCKNDLWGVAALAIMIGGPCLIEAANPPPREPAPTAYISERPGGSAAELWSVDSEHIEPDYSCIPLDKSLAEVLVESCMESNVPLELALALMEQESGFQVDAVSPSGCYGLCQLNPDWFPSGLSPAENIEAGVGYLGELLARYEGDQARALTAYYYGPGDRTSSWYSDEVLARAEKWR